MGKRLEITQPAALVRVWPEDEAAIERVREESLALAGVSWPSPLLCALAPTALDGAVVDARGRHGPAHQPRQQAIDGTDPRGGAEDRRPAAPHRRPPARPVGTPSARPRCRRDPPDGGCRRGPRDSPPPAARGSLLDERQPARPPLPARRRGSHFSSMAQTGVPRAAPAVHPPPGRPRGACVRARAAGDPRRRHDGKRQDSPRSREPRRAAAAAPCG